MNQGGGRQGGRAGEAKVGLTLGCCPPREAIRGARTCQSLCIGWILTTDTCQVGSKKKERKEQRPFVVSVCLPTNTLSASLPPLAPSPDLVVHHKPRATQFSPSLQCSSIDLPLRNLRSQLWALVSETCTRAQSTSSDCHCKWARRYCRPQIQLQKRGASQTASSGGRQDCRETCADLADSDLRRLEAGHRPFTALPIVSVGGPDLYILFFFHSLILLPGFGNWLWTVNLVGRLEGFGFTGCQDAAHRDGHNHQQVGKDHWQCECHPCSLLLLVGRCATLQVEGRD